ncbi:MAG: glycerol-3-phosphate dehydrogenase [NAD(P)+] [Minwuia thermotolerans]|nr:MAG: glycerol-3-phosphate dehydrogenase [NAD(P)+] [Minwuia thermotolerans]
MTYKIDIAIIGAGAWGNALQAAVGRAGPGTTLVGRGGEQQRSAVEGADALLLVVPAQTIRGVLQDLSDSIDPALPILICAKGLERETGALLPEVVSEVLPHNPVGMLSGPNFAGEVARGLPAAAVLAMDPLEKAEYWAAALGSPAFRLYASDDVAGVALGGAMKNVLAIAAGAVTGAGLGLNARAAVISRGLAELRRLGRAIGARDETLAGLSGLGDLVLTCTDETSRNFAFGAALGRDGDLPDVLVEGVHTVEPLVQRAAALGVELPIAMAVHEVLHLGTPLRQAVADLLARPVGAAEN